MGDMDVWEWTTKWGTIFLRGPESGGGGEGGDKLRKWTGKLEARESNIPFYI